MKNTKKLITRALALLLVAASLFSLPLFSTSAPQTDLLSVSAEAGVVYYPRYTGKSGSIVDGLKAVGVDSSFNNRKAIAAVNGISNYSGTAAQNTTMLNLLKQGKLIKSKTQDTPAVSYYPRYTGSSGSIVDALKAVGVDSSFNNRKAIAAANGISNYSGTAAQNTTMLNLLKQGKLKKAGSASGSGSSSGSGSGSSSSGSTTGTLEVYSNYNVSVSSKASANKPHYKNAEGKRGRDAYNTVINQFNVNTNSRYARTQNATYCNIFAWDVMSAMKVQLPHWIYSSGKPAEPFASGAYELNANATYNWLNNHGATYGWKKVSAADAQKRANSGYPTVVIWKNTSGGSGHVAVVRPEGNGYSYSSSNGPVTAQAGAQNKNYLNVKSGFGASRMSSVVYWTHN